MRVIRLLLANLLGVVIMKIKEFFKDCVHCRFVWIYVYHIDESGERKFKTRIICDFKDLDYFIIDYGNREIVEWTFENSEGDTEITFYLK